MKKIFWISWVGVSLLSWPSFAETAQELCLRVRADQSAGPVSRYLTGVCIEDVNHEIYGGLYSQMLYGESFQESPVSEPPQGFDGIEGTWRADAAGVLTGSAGAGFKLVSKDGAVGDGEVSVEILFSDKRSGNAGLLVKVAHPKPGPDAFEGYEVALNPGEQTLRLARHRNNYEPIRDVPCRVPAGEWIPLSVRMSGSALEVFVAGKSVLRYEDAEHPLAAGLIGLRTWQRSAQFRKLSVAKGGSSAPLPFVSPESSAGAVSRHWRPVCRGTAKGFAEMDQTRPFVGKQSQRLTFVSGEGEFGVENRGLNRVGLCLREHKPYEGVLWARTEQAVGVRVALESSDGAAVLAEQTLALKAGDWQRLAFVLVPERRADAGRFVVSLRCAGTVTLGYAFLQPGAWGRFKGLPVRRDVAEALIGQGVTVLRYGGSMINSPEYRWKKMIGPRDRRRPYACCWYADDSNGWGIPDFLNFCEAAGFLAIPALNIDETPQDIADFVEYANGPAESPWGRMRAADGHPAPYHLRHMELGNEERVDAAYAEKFKRLAEAVWSKDKEMILTVGDFAYGRPVTDPQHVVGAASKITALEGQRLVLETARAFGGEVRFDIHFGTHNPGDGTVAVYPTFAKALDDLANGAKHRVVVYELNANIHTMRRALANAAALTQVERDGLLPVVCSANGLQVNGQNDNGWDQGLLFMNPSSVWLQPPGYVTRMVSQSYQPVGVPVELAGDASGVSACARRSEDGRTLVVQIVNCGDAPRGIRLALDRFKSAKATARVEELAADLDACNTADEPAKIAPRVFEWPHGLKDGTTVCEVPAHSFTVMRFE